MPRYGEWVSTRTNPSSKFHKSKSLLPLQRQAEEKRWLRDVARQRFRHPPPLGSAFGSIGSFRWPVDDYRPEDVLGPSYEILDPIRMECQCYIIFKKETSSFEIMGAYEDVMTATMRIKKVCFQLAARQIPPLSKYLLHFPDGQESPRHVRLAPYQSVKVLQPPGVSPKPTGKAPYGEGPNLDDLTSIGKRSVRYIQKSLLRTLGYLQYYRGPVRLRVRLGTFLATHYREPEGGLYELEDFQEMLRQSQFEGEITAEIGDRARERSALRAVQAAGTVLVPQSGMIHNLLDVKPVYTAVFTIADKGGDLRLSKTWHEVHEYGDGKNTTLEELCRSWIRFDREAAEPSLLYDVGLCNLQDEGSHWHLGLTVAQSVEDSRLPQNLKDFANHLGIDAKVARREKGDLWVRIHRDGPVKKLQQRTSYRYGLMNSDYTIELTHFQDRIFGNNGHELICEPRWNLEVYHNLWDTMFSKNEHLAVGAMVDWDNDVETWFPEMDTAAFDQKKGNKGFEQLISKLEEIGELIANGPAPVASLLD